MDTFKINKLKPFFFFVLKLVLWLVLSFLFVNKMDFLGRHAILFNVLSGLYTVISVSMLVSIGRLTIVSLYRRRNRGMNERNNFILGINRIANILNSLFLIIGIMIALGINPKEFLTSITIVAMAIALLFREYITNMISGLIIMFSNQYSLGDLVKLGEYRGEIIDITLANIVIKSDDDDTILVPNNLVFTSIFVNESTQGSSKLVVKFELPLNASSQFDKLNEQLIHALRTYNDDVVLDSFSLRVVALEKKYVRYKINILVQGHASAKMKEIEAFLLLSVLQYKTTNL